MKKFILTSLILFSYTGLYAFSVSGRVIDSVTGNAVPDASVAIEELKSVQRTSAAGTFIFNDISSGYYTLHSAHPLYGNSTVTIRVKREFIIDIELAKTVHNIPPVINSYKKAENRPGSQSISSDDIKYMPLSGAGDSLHVLQTLPGVSSTFAMGSVPVIRGLNPIYDKTYIDDIPVDYPYHYFPPIVPFLSSINETIIDKATLHKSPYPMTYDDSIGSIIQVKTREVQQPGVHGKIILNPVLPVFPTIYCEAAPTADFSLLFAGRRTYIDWGADAADIDRSTTFYFQDHYLKLKYNLTSRHRFYLTMLGSDDYISLKKIDARSEYNVESLKWQYLISRKIFLETSFLRNRINHYMSDKKVNGWENPVYISYTPTYYKAAQTLTADFYVFDTKTGYEYIRHKDGVSGNINISDFTDYDIADQTGRSATAAFPIKGNTFSVFNETGVDLYPVHLNLGARYKHYGPLSSNSFSYRGMASYIVKSQRLKFYGGGGSYHAQPDMYYYLGNFSGNLKESNSYTGVLGFEKSLTDKITGQIETYYAKYNNLFSGVLGKAASTQLQKLSQINPYSKDTSGSAFGAECFIKGKLGPVYGWTSYSLSRSRMSDGTDEYFSDYDQTHLFKISVLTHLGRWTPSAVWHYSTSMPYTPITGSTLDTSGGYGVYVPQYGSYNSKRYPSHHKLDVKLTYTRGNARFYVEAWNFYYIKGYDRDENKFKTNRSYLFPVFHNSQPYSSSNPEKQSDLPDAFLWAGIEICF